MSVSYYRCYFTIFSLSKTQAAQHSEVMSNKKRNDTVLYSLPALSFSLFLTVGIKRCFTIHTLRENNFLPI